MSVQISVASNHCSRQVFVDIRQSVPSAFKSRAIQRRYERKMSIECSWPLMLSLYVSNIQPFSCCLWSNISEIYAKFMIYENTIVSDDVHSTVFVFSMFTLVLCVRGDGGGSLWRNHFTSRKMSNAWMTLTWNELSEWWEIRCFKIFFFFALHRWYLPCIFSSFKPNKDWTENGIPREGAKDKAVRWE